MGIRSGVEVDWFSLPVVYRLGDGWVALYGFVLSWDLWLVSWWGDGLGYEFLCHDVGLGYGGVLWWGSLLMMLDWGWDGGDNVPCSGACCRMRGWSWV